MEQTKQVAYTLLRVFFGALIGYVIAAGLNIIDMTPQDWKLAAGAAFAAVLVAGFRFLNPKDTVYGLGAGSE
jgi:hypothetical protein